MVKRRSGGFGEKITKRRNKMNAVGETGESPFKIKEFISFFEKHYTDNKIQWQFQNTVWYLQGEKNDLEMIKRAIRWRTFFFVELENNGGKENEVH